MAFKASMFKNTLSFSLNELYARVCCYLSQGLTEETRSDVLIGCGYG